MGERAGLVSMPHSDFTTPSGQTHQCVNLPKGQNAQVRHWPKVVCTTTTYAGFAPGGNGKAIPVVSSITTTSRRMALSAAQGY